jgi:tetratricopeptide (TPR) repeat protein/transcriptional regulator with XRE-family HTH domain
MTGVGPLLRSYRERAMLTQEELAARSGVSVSTIAGLESGRTLRPRSVSIRLLADALDLPPADRAALRAALAGESAVAAMPVVAPAQLPPDLAEFTGREDYLKRLDELHATVSGADATSHRAGTYGGAAAEVTDPADGSPETPEPAPPGGPRPGSVVISALGGTAGIGKTTLAVHWAHRVADRFPDGQLYVNLRGFAGGTPMEPSEAVRGFLTTLGIPPDRVPATMDGQVGLYRSLLAGRQMLVLLDNARDSEQVRPLLPGSAGCLVIVTSRNELTGLVATDGAQPLRLELLSLDEARQLLARRVGQERVEAEPAAVDEIIARCARLPLALAIVAARAASYPHFPLRVLAEELRETAGGLDAFAGGEAASDLRVVLSWSYERLSAPAARLFRLLGLAAGPEIGVPAAASLAGAGQSPSVRAQLGELVQAQLVTEHAPGRYGFHDLLRAYAAELATAHDPEPERVAAQGRLLDHYLHTAHPAVQLLQPRDPVDLDPPRDGVVPEPIPDRESAAAWFTREHPAMIAVIERAAARGGFDAQVWRLAWALEVFLQPRGLWDLCAASQRAALQAAYRLGDPTGQAYAHRMLARAYARLGRYSEAEEQYRLARDRFVEVGHPTGEAYVHLSLAWLRERQERYAEALDHSQQALGVFRASGHRTGLASALNMVGWFHARLGDHRRALDFCQQALALHEELGYQAGLAATWDSLGYAHHHLGDHQAAADCYRQALRFYREAGDRYNQADVLTHLGDTHDAAGERDAARQAWQQAVKILDQLGMPEDAHQLRTKLAAA